MKYNQITLIIVVFLIISPFIVSSTSKDNHILSFNSSEPILSEKNNKLGNQIEISTKNGVRKIQEYPKILRVADSVYSGGGLDPHQSFQPWLTHLMYDFLVEIDLDTGLLVPGLAYQWTVTNDSTEWTFYLREDVIFHDGSKFNASAVKFSFDRLYDETNPSFVESWIVGDTGLALESTEIVDEFTIKFNFYEPYSPLVNKLILIPIVSPTSFQNSVLTFPIGSGPYKIDSLSNMSETTLNLTRFNSYFRGLAPFEEIQYKSYGSNPDELNDLIISEQIDMVISRDYNIGDQGNALLNYIQDSEFWNITYNYNLARHVIGWFNYENEILRNLNVRKALNYAIDRQTYILDVRDGLGKIKSNILPRNVQFYNEDIEGYPFNLTKANKLLDDAGYIVGSDNLRFSLNVAVGGSGVLIGFQNSFDSFICSSLFMVNIGCNFTFDLEQINDTDIFIAPYQHISEPSILHDLLNSNGVNNYLGYLNPLMDELTQLARGTPVRQEQELYYGLIQTFAELESPYLLFADVPLINLRSESIKQLIGVTNMGITLAISSFDSSFDSNNSVNLKLSSFKASNNLGNINSYHNSYSIMSNISIGETGTYFPFTDTIMSTTTKPLTVTIEMSHQSSDFISSVNKYGKFYKITVNDLDSEYLFRSYYDLYEIESLPLENLRLFEWDASNENWMEKQTISNNATLRYIEIKLTGNSIIAYGFVEKEKFVESIIQVFLSIGLLGLIFYSFYIIKNNIDLYKWTRDLNGHKKY